MAFVLKAIGGAATVEDRVPLVGTPQQVAFWRELREGKTHVILEALAGTGKSTSCLEGMHHLLESDPTLSITYLCFNRKIAEDFRARGLPPGCHASTMHSLGRSACGRAFGFSDPVQDKSYKILDSIHGHGDRKLRSAVSKLVGLAKNTLSLTDPDSLAELAGFYQVDIPAGKDIEVLGLAHEVLWKSAERTSVIDFDDMLWLPFVHDLTFPRCDVLFIDESQDLNRLQQELIPLICPSGRIFVVGDRNQAIYGFRGADSESIPRLERMLSPTPRGLVKLPLTMTRRCPKSHVNLAKRIVPAFDSLPEAPTGRLDFEVPLEDILRECQPGWLLLCRTNAPLVSACLKLIVRGIPASIRGRNVGDGLIALIESFNARDLARLSSRLDSWESAQLDWLAEKDSPASMLEAVQDKADCIRALMGRCRTPLEILGVIADLFRDDDDSARVILSSVHRAKGSEADTVAILRPDLMPHPMARQDWERQQERNIEYVAITRSKFRLIFAAIENERATQGKLNFTH